MVINPLGPQQEQGTIVSPMTSAGVGRIRAANGDTIVLLYASVLQGFRRLTVGQRVEFTRGRVGLQRNVASLVVALDPPATSE